MMRLASPRTSGRCCSGQDHRGVAGLGFTPCLPWLQLPQGAQERAAPHLQQILDQTQSIKGPAQAACAQGSCPDWGCGMLHASVHFWLDCLSSSWERAPCAFRHQNHLLELCLESPAPLEAAGREELKKRQSEILPWKEIKQIIK